MATITTVATNNASTLVRQVFIIIFSMVDLTLPVVSLKLQEPDFSWDFVRGSGWAVDWNSGRRGAKDNHTTLGGCGFKYKLWNGIKSGRCSNER